MDRFTEDGEEVKDEENASTEQTKEEKDVKCVNGDSAEKEKVNGTSTGEESTVKSEEKTEVSAPGICL